jgi:hypothetical protein
MWMESLQWENWNHLFCLKVLFLTSPHWDVKDQIKAKLQQIRVIRFKNSETTRSDYWLYRQIWSRFELTTLVVIGIGCWGSCKSNNHKITNTTALCCLIMWVQYYFNDIVTVRFCWWRKLLWVRISIMRDVLDIILCDKVCQWLVTHRWFSPGTPVSYANKTDRYDIHVAEILSKVALNIEFDTHNCQLPCDHDHNGFQRYY